MANTKIHTFKDSKITLNVVEPTNVTGNDAHISQRFWTNSNQPFSGNTGNMERSDKYDWYGRFISCMELDWGNAKGSESDFIKSAMTENQIKTLLFDQGIKTSDELLQVLCWLFKNRGSNNISFDVTGTTSVNYNGTITLTAVVGEGGDVDVTTWKWNTSNSSFTNNSITGITSFTPSGNGASKTLKIVGNNQSYNSWSLPTPTAPAVTLSSSLGSNTCKCTPGTASRTGKALTIYVQAYNSTTTTATVVKQCTFGAPSTQTQEATAYSWSIVSGGDYITLTNTTSQTCTIIGKNSTYSQQTAKIKCTVTYGSNGTKDTSDITITIPAANVTLSSIQWVNTTASSTYGQSINWPQIQLNYSDGTNSKINGNASGVTYSTTLTSSTNAGSYSNITATYQSKTTSNKLNYTINKANLSLTVDITGWTAGSTPNSPTVTGNTGGGSITYKYKVSTADDSTYTTTVPTTAGTYIVQATVAATTNYNSGTATKQFTISAKPVTNTYYYYAGWTLPTTSNVDTIIAETYPSASGSSTNHTAGKKTTSKSTMDYTSNTLYNANAKATYYVLVPTGHAIYDSLNNNVIASTFTSKGNITVGNQTHTIYASNSTSRNIGAIIIK